MASLTIPSRWLSAQPCRGGWTFRCATTLDDLVRTHRAARYFRQLVTILEEERHILNYHMKLRHNSSQNNRLDVIIYYGSTARTENPAPIPVCISCDPTHDLSEVALLSEQQHTRAWLDARARRKLILTPVRHVQGLSELTDENGEMEAFWQDAVDLLHRECDQLHRFYPDLIINHGTYRNHEHLHLKMAFSKSVWDATIAVRHQERITQVQELLQSPVLKRECFGLGKDKEAKTTKHEAVGSRKS